MELVGLGRVELPTSPLSGVRSSQLSYRPGLVSRASLLISRTELNVRTGYAGPDHRADLHEKRGSIESLNPCQDRSRGVHGNVLRIKRKCHDVLS